MSTIRNQIPTRRDPWVNWARLLVVLFVAGVLLGSLAGCKYNPPPESPEESSHLAVYTDPATGCQYLRPLGYSGLAPRMDRNGKQVCK